MTQEPKISVLLPVYNAASFVVESVQSILDQTESDFELLIIDDCSTDGTLKLIQEFDDSRIRIHKKEINTGYTNSLNWAIDQARGRYIARMDADDVSLPERFEKQLAFLEQHPDIAICGTDAFVEGGSLKFNYPTDSEHIRVNLLFGSSLIHPSIMGLKELFQQFKYDVSKEPAEDYDLFVRLVAADKKLANLPHKLLIYRVHPGQTSGVQRQKQIRSAQQSMLRMFKLFGYNEERFPEEFVILAIWPDRLITDAEFKLGISFYKALLNCSHPFHKNLIKKAIKIKAYNFYKVYAAQGKYSKWQKVRLFLKYSKVLDTQQSFKFALNG